MPLLWSVPLTTSLTAMRQLQCCHHSQSKPNGNLCALTCRLLYRSLSSHDTVGFCMQDTLKWGQVHVIGHSMGAMVATQLASMHPDRLLSLTLISVTAGRWQSVPLNWAAIKYAWQVSISALARFCYYRSSHVHTNYCQNRNCYRDALMSVCT